MLSAIIDRSIRPQTPFRFSPFPGLHKLAELLHINFKIVCSSNKNVHKCFLPSSFLFSRSVSRLFLLAASLGRKIVEEILLDFFFFRAAAGSAWLITTNSAQTIVDRSWKTFLFLLTVRARIHSHFFLPYHLRVPVTFSSLLRRRLWNQFYKSFYF